MTGLMEAWRMNGAGNAFIVIDARGAPAPEITSENVRALARREAFDQLILISKAPGHDASLAFWNRDGGEAGACGNGTRAAAWLIFQDTERGALSLASRAGPLAARRLESGGAEVDLGPARLDWRAIPLAREMDTVRLDYAVDLPGGGRLEGPGAVSMGNPHVVFFDGDPEDLPLEIIGPQIETDPLFPERVNAGFAQIRAPGHIRLRVWERGAGLTKACGTGAAAALVAACRQGRTEREAVIEADGGLLPVRWDKEGHVHLAGPVEMEGRFDLEDGGL